MTSVAVQHRSFWRELIAYALDSSRA